jgi:chorismate mutase
MAVKRCGSLDEVRAEIDAIDDRIVELLAERRGYVLQAGQWKPSAQAVRAPAREAQVIARVRAAAEARGLEPDLAERVYRALIDGFVEIEAGAHPRKS